MAFTGPRKVKLRKRPKAIESSHFLLEVRLEREKVPSFDEYPFSLQAIRNLHSIVPHPAVTFLVGENGSGKSTLLEAIAVTCGFNAEGGTRNFNFATRETHSPLYQFIRPVRGVKRPRSGFFLRAESLYNVASNIDDLGLTDYYGGTSLHAQSHGESFFTLFMEKFQGQGLYFMDEPEAALSPTRQMSLIARMHELVQEGAQFIIATHSPILMAYPNADILAITPDGPQPVAYTDTEHYRVTRDFLMNREKMLKILMDE